MCGLEGNELLVVGGGGGGGGGGDVAAMGENAVTDAVSLSHGPRTKSVCALPNLRFRCLRHAPGRRSALVR